MAEIDDELRSRGNPLECERRKTDMPRLSRMFDITRIVLALLLVNALHGCDRGATPPDQFPIETEKAVDPGIDSTLEAKRTPDATLQSLFQSNSSNVQVLVRGVVTRFLSDDVEGDKHQRFILKLASGQTLLIAHNIDLATRIPGDALGKTVYVYGEYEWNSEGGVVHWTHRDPDKVHENGWIQHADVRYW